MDDYQFQDFGCELPQDDWSTRQANNVPQSWITTPNIFDWDTGFQDHIITNNYIPPETHVGWLNPVMSAPLGGFELSWDDAALQDITSYSSTPVPEIGVVESNTVGTVLSSSSTAGQVVEVRPASFAAQQSQPHYDTRKCAVESCEYRYVAVQDGRNHMQTMHPDMHTCDQCMEVFKNAFGLECHAYGLHIKFVCKQENCGRGFTRADTYKRHQRDHLPDVRRFPCRYCKKYRGKNGFKRKDHLTQHVRNYHHIGEDSTSSMHWRTWCPKSDCTKSEPAGVAGYSAESAFSSSKQWVSHMRTEHDECEYSCPQPGCDRVKGKGYFRAADLRTHLRKVHGTDGSFDESIRNKLYSY